MDPEVQTALVLMHLRFANAGKPWHRGDHEFQAAIEMFVNLYLSGNEIDRQNLQDFLPTLGLDKRATQELGDMADIVYYTLKFTNQIA